MRLFRITVSAIGFAVFVAAFQLHAAPPVAAASAPNEAGAVLSFASNQLNKRYEHGASGLRRYDCSGLVWRAFYESGLSRRIGGERTSRGYYNWFRNHGRITSRPQRGDLVVWARKGHRVSHIGIFWGYNRNGKPMAISALSNPYGVSLHKVNGIDKPLRAYLHVDLSR